MQKATLFHAITMSAHPHTLDNLCQSDKDKVVEMLKQLNEMKKRCTGLEQDLESRQLENERLTGRDDVMSHSLEATHARLIDVIESSKASQVQIESLSLRLQQSDAERKAVEARVRDSQSEVCALRDAVRRARAKRDRSAVTTSTQARPLTSEKAVNTAETALGRRDAAAQAAPEPPPPTVAVAVPVAEPAPAVSNPRRDVAPPTDARTESDDELAQLISYLNPF
jgi:chromosome segregation ATPase